jgi:hypothetical protein
MVSGDDMVKDQLRQLGILDLVVTLLQGTAAAQGPSYAKQQQQQGGGQPVGPASPLRGPAASGDKVHRLIGPSGQVITPWDRFLAACLMEAILGGAYAQSGAVVSAVLLHQAALEPGVQLNDQHSQTNGQHQQPQARASAHAANSNTLPVSSLVRFGLLLPLLAQSGEETAPCVSHGAGEATPGSGSEGDGAVEPAARLSLVTEAVGALAALMEDCPLNTARAVEVGVVPALCQVGVCQRGHADELHSITYEGVSAAVGAVDTACGKPLQLASLLHM